MSHRKSNEQRTQVWVEAGFLGKDRLPADTKLPGKGGDYAGLAAMGAAGVPAGTDGMLSRKDQEVQEGPESIRVRGAGCAAQGGSICRPACRRVPLPCDPALVPR